MQSGALQARSQRDIRYVDRNETNAHLIQHIQKVFQSLQRLLGVPVQFIVRHSRVAIRIWRFVDQNK